MNNVTLQQASEQLAQGSLQASDLLQQAFSRINAPDGEGKRTFIRVYTASATQQAQAADARQQKLSALDGIPVSIKDLFDVAGETTTGGSAILATADAASANAAVVDRLLQAGAVIVGKTNMTEFAYSGLGINPHYGTPANAFDRASRRIPGGSSSGAAVALTDGMCLGSVGTDTGGSVRIPAALCGLTGFKPTARRISAAGLQPLSPSLDSIGVLAHNVSSCLLLDAVIAGEPLTAVAQDLSHARFAVPQTLALDGMDEAVSSAFYQAIEQLKAQGATVDSLPLSEFSELATINARGGFTALESWQWHQSLIARQPEKYDPRVISRIRRGAELTDADRITLEQQRADWQQRVSAELTGYHALLMPTVPVIAPVIAELEADEEHYFRVNGAMLRNPSIINFLDGCSISLPCQPAGAAPVGLMVSALPMQDSELMGWALSIEQALTRA
ncbi:amidase [Erwiniaceae bacterium BAC15a-03b]|uniref:Amidase n=1 Tax=Winslowiella arboricola TaxID=2978220 RepID=A0A9J6PRJ1_9GAMM|nr:amidase [Winslowiella arboricola]MCU5774782.1 amidase [Winslowiella arboricola]MCU5780066.1 amidase [Winslowiella arboricola]